jgi:UDP-galactopyranose mutase
MGTNATAPVRNETRLRPRSTPVLICLSHLRWNFVYQRPQHLLSRAAKTYPVYFIEEPMFEAGATPRLTRSVSKEGVHVVTPVLPEGMPESLVVQTQRRMLDQLLVEIGRGPLIAWYYTPMALRFSRQLAPDVCIYDNMDELSAFKGASRELLDLETELFRRADLVFTGGQSLYEAKRDRHRNIHPFPSSIDPVHFTKARSARLQDPADQAAIPHPRLGFFGVVDERMDIALVGRIAELQPNWHFVMIGPVVKIDPAILPRRANIHWLGGKSYTDLPAYLAGWDVGIMPFALNESTRFISPTKTPEFLAAGLPVVSTPIRDVVRPYGEKGLVAIADTPEAFVRAAGAMLRGRPSEWLSRVDRHLATTSWDTTWRRMLDHIEQILPKPRAEMRAAALVNKGEARV